MKNTKLPMCDGLYLCEIGEQVPLLFFVALKENKMFLINHHYKEATSVKDMISAGWNFILIKETNEIF